MYKRKGCQRDGIAFELGMVERPRQSGECSEPEPKRTTMLSGNRPTNANRSRSLGPKSVPADRRSRRRLRDLCDEVLASYRIASNRDVITDSDRADAQVMLARIAPLGLAK